MKFQLVISWFLATFLNIPLSIVILKFSLAAKPRGHKQRKLNDHVYSFRLFVSRPHCLVEFLIISKLAYWEYLCMMNNAETFTPQPAVKTYTCTYICT